MIYHRLFHLVSAVALATTILVIMAFALASLPQGQPARSAPAIPEAGGVINVTTTLDEYDTSSNGTCSLREAIESINTSSSFGGCANPGNAADTIDLLAATYTLTIPYTTWDNSSGSLMPTTTMTIRGMGPGQTSISADSSLNDPVITTDACSVRLEGLTIRGGTGIGIYVDLPPVSPPTTLVNVVIEDTIGGPGLRISSQGISGVQATSALILTDVIIRNNHAASEYGGAIAAYDGGYITITNSSLYGNYAGRGGGIYFWDRYGGDSFLHLTNVTIYSNTAESQGGGLYIQGVISSNVALRNVTLAGNSTDASEVSIHQGGNLYNYGSGVSLINTIVALGTVGSAANNCAGNPAPNITSLGHNLEDANTCGLNSVTDMVNTDPRLGPLADNGGRTPTMALHEESPAIDEGDCSSGPTRDQRGFVRLPPCDIGAFEYNADKLRTNFLPLMMRNY